jgi:hypothetical protein
MAKGQKSIGRKYKRVLTTEEIAQIEIQIYKGNSSEEIREMFHLTKVLFNGIRRELKIETRRYPSTGKWGHKDEAYYTEEELLKGIPEYTFKDLSRHEKQFYLNYNLWKK